MKIKMIPHAYQIRDETDGISQVVKHYFKYLPEFGVDLVLPDADDFDLKVIHAGMQPGEADVAHCHGLYWTADYPVEATLWERRVNAGVIDSLRRARMITVPSAWVSETFRRDMRIYPYIVPHGIDVDEWDEPAEVGDYVLWNKNRAGDVCDPTPIVELAGLQPRGRFVTTFVPYGSNRRDLPGNLSVTGIIPHDQMKKLVKSSLVYLATTKETFGIGILEAMAAGVPVLGYDWGGIRDLIEHGETGYLAEPGNVDDLHEGLNFCIKYRDRLGTNGREAAREWTWKNAVRILFDVYQETLWSTSTNDVAVVIPCYNYSHKVERAIKSCLLQNLLPKQIIVVDDGSDDGDETEAVVRSLGGAAEEAGVELVYIRQENAGVAHARNRGITETSTQFICCLDADDAIDPEFLSYCVPPLVQDRSLGITYTGITTINPDGKLRKSEWPPKFDYEQMLNRRNQVPTCCVFRRDAWERLGGYRQRYAPHGAGAEDAEFWLRIGALGYNARRVTSKGLFYYSIGEGRVAGNPNYREVDWTFWHPWTKDGRHPFASIAEPATISHPVRQYDQPVISAIIPVGPGHDEFLLNALDSLEAQTIRNWEAVVVWDSNDYTRRAWYETTYPYVRFVDYTDAPVGAGAARNRGADVARGDFFMFLDADDWLYPQAFETLIDAWAEHRAIPYSDYVGKAIVDDISKLDQELQERIYRHDEQTKETVIGYRAAEYDCERACRQPVGNNPWVWCNIPALVPAAWHFEIDGFDETMPSWEDILYFYTLARRQKCFVRVPEELYVYNLHLGKRRGLGGQNHENLLSLIREKLEGVEKMACKSCGGNRVSPDYRQVLDARQRATRTAVPDEDFVEALYMAPNRGSHQVLGQTVFTRPIDVGGLIKMVKVHGGYRINYGYHSGGGTESFLVHRQDVQISPHLFHPVDKRETRVDAPRRETRPPRAPRDQRPPVKPPERKTEKTADDLVDFFQKGQRTDQGDREQPASWPSGDAAIVSLQNVPGIGVITAERLVEMGVNTPEQILELGADGLAEIKGMGPTKAAGVIDAIKHKKELDKARELDGVHVSNGGKQEGDE